jgi:cytoskeletal protein CcmA (bactofilin family)
MTDSIKRLNYFNGQFLRAPDFTEEQTYHLEMGRRHNQKLHTWGIADGLKLQYTIGSSQIEIAEGMAIDSEGREIVLVNKVNRDLSTFLGKTVYITIAYNERKVDETKETGVEGFTRVQEIPNINVSENPPSADQLSLQLILGRVTVNSEGKITATDEGEGVNRRRAAGVVAGDLEARSLTLTDPNVDPSQWSKMRLGAAGRADLNGDLRVTGKLEVTGTVDGRDVSADGTKLDTHTSNTNNPHQTTAAQIDNQGGTNRLVTQINASTGVISEARIDPAIARDSEVTTAINLAVRKAGDTMTGALTIQSNLTVTGNVGFATTAAPSERLEVNGKIRATSFLGDGSTLTGVVRTAGDIMTGALTIQNNLTVTGKVSVTGNLSVTNILEIGDTPLTGNTGGNRDWMQKGIKINWDSDSLFIGLKDEGTNRKDAVIAWGDDPQDDLRFINVLAGGDVQGKELMRIKPSGNVFINGTLVTEQTHTIKIGVPSSTYENDGIRGEPNLWLDAAGTVFIKSGFQSRGLDVAERFKVLGHGEIGSVMVMDEQEKAIKLCERAYDPCVVGIISGEPAFILGLETEHQPIALCGRVPCNVDADIAPIKVGDLLTTSPTKGYAQKALEIEKATGTIIGKALESLSQGKGQITGLVILQ